MSEDQSIRRLRIGSNVVIQLVLGLVLFGVVNYLSFRHYRRWDLSFNQDYTLSQTTTNFLSKLESDITIVVAFVRGSEIFDDVRILVDEYRRNAGDRIRVEFVDPARAPDRAEELKNRYALRLDRNVVIVDRDGRTKLLREEDLATTAGDAARGTRVVEFRGEDALTSALIAVSEKDQKKLYLITGKSQLPQSPYGDASGVLNDLARKQNIQLSLLNPADVTTIPSDANGLVLINPIYDLSERELAMVRDYWEAERGAFFVLLNPAARTPLLASFLRDFGIDTRDDRVLYAESTPLGPVKQFTVQGTFVPGSIITQSLLGVSTTIGGQSHSIGVAENSDRLRQEGIEVRPLIEAAPKYWGESRYIQELPTMDRDDTPPPVFLAASIERGAAADSRIRLESSRLVVVSNPTILDPDPKTFFAANYDFAANALNWLLAREELIGIPPRVKKPFSLRIPGEQRSRILLIVSVLLPACVLAFGVFVWSMRRS